MIKVNNNFSALPESYLFSEVGRRIRSFKELHPESDLVRMDIGDVTKPLFPSVISSMKEAVAELADATTFKGYGPEQGYLFLRELIADHDYRKRGIEISADDIFISDGAKSDLGNLGDIFSKDCKVAVMNPSYPVYVDDNVIDGRGGSLHDGIWSGFCYLDCDPDNGFLPRLPEEHVDLIYLCFPNNPTGVAVSRRELEKWVEYARREGSLIIYDSAYEAFVRGEDIVRSIYEIPGAKEVALEVRSFSKTAGFTGLRCGYTVVPEELKGVYSNGEEVSLKKLWNRRQTTKFNGASYVSQKAASGIYTEEGRREVREAIDGYLANAALIRDTFEEMGFKAFGGKNSPYVWVSAGNGLGSWELFDLFLNDYGFSTTPGCGFGTKGEGYVRLTGFNSRENTEKAMGRLKSWLR